MMLRSITQTLCLAAGLVVTAHASEREALTYVARGIEALRPLIEQAADQTEPEVRKSRYNCLRADVELMAVGIETHLAGPRAELHTMKGLCLDYLGLASKPGLVLAEGELAPLARLAHELGALEPLIADAERQAEAGTLRFQYAWLRADLAQVRGGIEHLLGAPRTVPRAFAPMSADYRP